MLDNSFNIDKTSVCLTNCHLANGKDNSQKRFNEIKEIYSCHVGDTSDKTPKDHDIQFLFGDLNFRVEFGDELTFTYAKNKEYDKLLKNDQLWCEYHQYNYLPDLTEPPIEFAPTYRFEKDGSYSTAKSSPAWCDRILCGDVEEVKFASYKMIDELLVSKHKPVCGNYLVTINHSKKTADLSKSTEDVKSDLIDKKEEGFKIVKIPSETELSSILLYKNRK